MNLEAKRMAVGMMLTTADEQTLISIEKLLQGKTEKKRLLKTKEVCEMLDVTSRTVQNYARAGYLHPIYWSSSKVRYDYEEVINFMNNGGESA